jgi:N-sulfoglucosamine sulfohydrolase
VKRQLKQQVRRELRAQGNPRMFGKGYIFDQCQYSNPEQKDFYESFMRGEKVRAGWVNESDFEKGPVK